MQKLLINITVMAALTVAAPIALATTRTIPLPHPSHYADTESSTNVALVGWNDLTRRFLVDLVAAATPSNCLELAYGTDANNDNILAPEETDLRLGLDCGEPFMRDEKNGEAVSRPLEESTLHSPTPTLNYNSTFDLSRLFNRDWNLVKVTTRGTFALPPVIKARYRTNPLVFILK